MTPEYWHALQVVLIVNLAYFAFALGMENF
jgi:hypothetical protein